MFLVRNLSIISCLLFLTFSFFLYSLASGRTKIGSPPLSGIQTSKSHFPFVSTSSVLLLFNFEIIPTFPLYKSLSLPPIPFIATHSYFILIFSSSK